MEFSSRRAGLGAVALAACIAAAPAWADDDEDCKAGGSLRLVNGKIHTMDKKDSVVSSVLIKNGKGAWRALLDRERHRVDGETPNLVLIAGAAAPSNDGDWQFRAMSA